MQGASGKAKEEEATGHQALSMRHCSQLLHRVEDSGMLLLVDQINSQFAAVAGLDEGGRSSAMQGMGKLVAVQEYIACPGE